MFTSLWFLVFFAAFALVWYLVSGPRRWWVMLLGSLGFYLAFSAKCLPILALAALIVWWCALRVEAVQNACAASEAALPADSGRTEKKALRAVFAKRQRGWVVLGTLAALAPLIALKYLPVLLRASPLAKIGQGWIELAAVFLPLGISYYTLQLIGYLVDVSRTVIPAEKNYGRVLCYAVFFLSITQGPFNRYGALMPQMDAGQPAERQRIVFGLQRMAWGYFQKLAVADRAAVAVNAIYDNYSGMDRSQLLFGMVAFGIQLYADFSGYTNIALGAGEVLGLSLPENFRQPFWSRSISEFWQRWHITLGAWLKDYIFYPVLKSEPLLFLGRKLKGRFSKKLARKIPTWLGMLILWLAIGLWHGAGLQYVFGTGLLQFLYIFLGELAEPLFVRLRTWFRVEKWPRLFAALQAVRTTCLMLCAWVFFRAQGFSQAVDYLRCVVTNAGHRVFSNYWEMGLVNRYSLFMLLLGAGMLLLVDALQVHGHSLRKELAEKNTAVRWVVYQAAIWAFLFMGVFLGGATGTFLYARF